MKRQRISIYFFSTFNGIVVLKEKKKFNLENTLIIVFPVP